MSKNWTITILGLLVAFIPLLGFPGAWKTFFIIISGLAIAVLSFSIIIKDRSSKLFPKDHWAKPDDTDSHLNDEETA